MSALILRRQLRDAIQESIVAVADRDDFTAEHAERLWAVSEAAFVGRGSFVQVSSGGARVCCPVALAFPHWEHAGVSWDPAFATSFDAETREVADFARVLLVNDERGA